MFTPRTMPIRVMLVDDHAVVRSGLRMLLESQSNIVVLGEAQTVDDVLPRAASTSPDIVVLDLDLGGTSSLDILPDLLNLPGTPRVIMLTGSRDADEHVRAVRLGAMGVVIKDQAAEVLLQAVEKVAAGEAWLDPVLTARLVTGLNRRSEAPKHDPEARKIPTPTEREREVIGLICEGLQNKVIGQRLFISETTVRHHLTSIFNKLGVENRLELVIYAYRHGLTVPPGQTG